MQEKLFTEKSLDGSYENMVLIYSGLSASTWKGVEKTTKREVVLKIEHEGAKPETLFFEACLYSVLWRTPSAEKYIPRVYGCFSDERAQIMYMEMELLGNNLKEVFQMCNNKFSLKTVLILADQMFSILDFIHSEGIVHRDIKLENFVFGRKEKKNSLFLVDFGLGEKLIRNGKHIPYDDGDEFIGTLMYAPVNAHYGMLLTRRDDLTSLTYVFLKLLSGKLPWEDEKKRMEAFEVKLRHMIGTQLFSGFPEEFAMIFEYAQNTYFQVKPDYDYLRKLFGDLYKKMGFDKESKDEFEWDSFVKE